MEWTVKEVLDQIAALEARVAALEAGPAFAPYPCPPAPAPAGAPAWLRPPYHPHEVACRGER